MRQALTIKLLSTVESLIRNSGYLAAIASLSSNILLQQVFSDADFDLASTNVVASRSISKCLNKVFLAELSPAEAQKLS